MQACMKQGSEKLMVSGFFLLFWNPEDKPGPPDTFSKIDDIAVADRCPCMDGQTGIVHERPAGAAAVLDLPQPRRMSETAVRPGDPRDRCILL